jgi:transcriptional regulator with XRE-family HTH domain
MTSNMTNRGERLRRAREKVHKSGRQAAFALGIPNATYNAHEHAQQPGGRDYSPEEAQVYARHFGVRPEYLLMGHVARESEPVDKPATVPIIGWVDPNDEVHFYPNGKELVRVTTFDGAVSKTVAVEIRNKGDLDMWLAFYDDEKLPPIARLYGHTCVVGLTDGRVFMRRMNRSARRNFVHLVSRNSQPVTDVRPNWAARVHTIKFPGSRRQL